VKEEKRRFDVAVIGAGPAGMSAAIRVRFVKEHEAMTLSTVLIDPGPVGGLLNAGRTRFVTGPSNLFEAELLLSALQRDVANFNIPVRQARAVRVLRRGDGSFATELLDGSVVRSSAVVLATGSRPLSNEMKWLGKGVFITSRGVSFFPGLLAEAKAFASQADRGIPALDAAPVVVVTNRNVRDLLPAFRGLGHPLLFLVPPGDERKLKGMPGEVLPAGSWRILRKEGNVLVVSIGEGTAFLSAGAIVLDYISFQRQPLLPEFDFDLMEERPGVPKVDSMLQTSCPGLFLAGDVTCRYASIACALADGVTAGFGAYTHAYSRMYGKEPPLFAYRAPEKPAAYLRLVRPGRRPAARKRHEKRKGG